MDISKSTDINSILQDNKKTEQFFHSLKEILCEQEMTKRGRVMLAVEELAKKTSSDYPEVKIFFQSLLNAQRKNQELLEKMTNRNEVFSKEQMNRWYQDNFVWGNWIPIQEYIQKRSV